MQDVRRLRLRRWKRDAVDNHFHVCDALSVVLTGEKSELVREQLFQAIMTVVTNPPAARGLSTSRLAKASLLRAHEQQDPPLQVSLRDLLQSVSDRAQLYFLFSLCSPREVNMTESVGNPVLASSTIESLRNRTVPLQGLQRQLSDKLVEFHARMALVAAQGFSAPQRDRAGA